MSLKDFNTATEIIEKKELGRFAGPRDEALVSEAENALGLKFPIEYRAFLLKFGAGNFGSAEFFGITTNNFENASIPNGIWYTLDERKNTKLPHNLIIIGDVGMGEFYCIKIQNEGLNPIVVYIPGLPEDKQNYEVLADDFGSYFFKKIQEQV